MNIIGLAEEELHDEKQGKRDSRVFVDEQGRARTQGTGFAVDRGSYRAWGSMSDVDNAENYSCSWFEVV